LEDRLLLDGGGLAAPAADNFVKWTFGDTQNNLYVLKSFSPQDANVGPIGALDPALDLVIGVRYTATIGSFPHHPLELIAGGATPFDDIVLLAQTNKNEPLNQTAEWESDPGVDWQTDPEAKSVSFTLTPALAAAMFDPALGLTPEYRCGNPFHRGFQRGSLLLSSGAPAPKDAPHDGFGATFAAPSSLTVDSQGRAAADGTLETSGGIDVFRYVAPTNGLLTVTQAAAAGSALNSLVLIYNDSQQLIDVGGTGTSGAAGDVQVPVVAGNTYFIQAAGYQGTTGAFHLAVSIQPQRSAAPGAPSIALDALGSASVVGAVVPRGSA